MSKTQEILSLLTELKELLIREKEILIANNGEALLELLPKKESLMIQLAEFDEENVEVGKLSVLSHEIKALQETNLTLTEQSIQFTETMMDYIKKAANKQQTYSKKGTYESSKKSALLDQSL
ncbi:hypothetical protein GCM10008932_20880 [Alkalibacterium iburiense]|uniref:FlgN protein n=1 Tax=Alkalibacterium iburiense TaxID=290589 RepID=A0ABN0XNS6_9LACT